MIFLCRSNETSPICPCCGKPLAYRDSRKRICKAHGGVEMIILIRRMKYTGCRRLHNELPDCLTPHKHYGTEVIEDVVDEVVTPCDPVTEDYPCEATMKRWKQWIKKNILQIDGELRSIGHRILGFSSQFLSSGVSLLRKLRTDGAGWLGICQRILSWQAAGFSGLKPADRQMQRHSSLPVNFDELLAEAIQLKREVPTRSVAQIILILEMEGLVPSGQLKRSTLQRHLYQAGFGKKQMKKYTQARQSSSKRFCKPHRMMLTQADLKYGMKLPIGNDGKMKQTYLSVIIDNHSRLVLASGFYDNQEAEIVEDTYRKAMLTYGKMDATYVDRGKQYLSTQLMQTLGKLGIRLIKAKPYSPQSKGGVEVFNRFVDAFLAEARAQKIKTLEALNHYWNIWLESYYHEKPHEGIREYYKSQGIDIPAEGITPRQEWNHDSRPLVFLDATVVGEAFLHHEKRIVDKGACISFGGLKYETSPALIGASVEIAYDPMDPEMITISYPGIEPFTSRPLKIGSFCDRKPELPLCMLPEEPETSRFLNGLQRKHEQNQQLRADAISFGNYRKEGSSDV